MPCTKLLQFSSRLRTRPSMNGELGERRSNLGSVVPSPKDKSIIGSFTGSRVSAGSFAENMGTVNNDKFKYKQMMKMLLIVFIPLLALLAISILYFQETLHRRSEMHTMVNALDINKHVFSLVSKLQTERGRTAVYLGLNSDEARGRLKFERTQTDLAIDVLRVWPVVDSIPTRAKFINDLEQWRSTIDGLNASSDDNVEFYTTLTTAFLHWGNSLYTNINLGPLWSKFVAKYTISQALDLMGIARAMGAVLHIQCGFNIPQTVNFVSHKAQMENLLNLTEYYDKKSMADFYYQIENRYIKDLGETWNLKLDQIFSTTFKKECKNQSLVERYRKSDEWFRYMTDYMSMLVVSSNKLSERILVELEATVKSIDAQFIGLSCFMVIMVVLCLALSLWYVWQIYKILVKISQYAKKVACKSHELQQEKRRTEMLLYQMLPKSVADALRNRQPVEAELFDSVSVYFSDIVGFTDLCSRSTPYQVVEFLNSLYTVFDSTIERYEVYKVETIGDAYMVASGVPSRIGSRHLVEISSMALSLQEAVRDFKIAHMPGERLQLRAGAHAGSVVAGVVGNKMPRYCLFGDTVNTASRMETNGKAMHVHVSESFHDALLSIKDNSLFVMEPREEVMELKGKGKMQTYWLYRNLAHEKEKSVIPHARFDIIPGVDPDTNNTQA